MTLALRKQEVLQLVGIPDTDDILTDDAFRRLTFNLRFEDPIGTWNYSSLDVAQEVCNILIVFHRDDYEERGKAVKDRIKSLEKLKINHQRYFVRLEGVPTDPDTLQYEGGLTEGEVDKHIREHDDETNAHSSIRQDIRDHERSTHNTDTEARGAISAHTQTPHNTDTTARLEAAAAKAEIDKHERNHPDGTDQVARDAAAQASREASTAKSAADNAQTKAEEVEASLATEADVRGKGDDFQAVVIASASSYQSNLNAQRTSDQPLMAVIDADIEGTRGGSPYSWNNGDVLTFAPRSDKPERWFNIKSAIPSDVPDGSILKGVVTKGLFTQGIYDLLAARDKLVSYGINSVEQLHQVLTDSEHMKLARLLFFDVQVNETHQTITYVHKRNSVGYALPGESTVTNLFSTTDTKIKHAGTSAELSALLTTHITESTDLFVYINAGFRRSGITYAKGSFISFKPESVTPTVEFTLPVKSTSIRIEPPSIEKPADLDGDYALFLGIPDYKNSEVDQLEIWFKQQGVHQVSNFKPEDGPFVIPFNVNTSEETQIGLQASDNYIQVLAVYRKGGQYVGQDTTVLGVKNQAPTGTNKQDKLTNQQLEELIDLRLTPTVVVRGEKAFKTFKITSDDPSILGSSVWVNTNISGQRTARQRLTGAELTFAYSDAVSETINQNIPSGDRQLRVDIELWAADTGGSTIAILRRDITLQDSDQGRVNITGASWNTASVTTRANFPIKEDIQRGHEYAFKYQDNFDSNEVAMTSVFWGDDLLDIPAQDTSFVGVAAPRIDADGARAMRISRTNDSKVIRIVLGQAELRIVALYRLGRRS